MTDDEILDRAAHIIRRESSRPASILITIYCRILTDKAADIRRRRSATLIRY
jgi:hypothetical protein